MANKFVPSDECPTLASYYWLETFKFCACGNPEIVLGHLRDAMRALKDQSDYSHSRPAFGWTPEDQAKSNETNRKVGRDCEPLYYLTGYLLDAGGLTEHGGSVPGWLTPEGEALLAFLEGTPEEEWIDGPYPEGP